MPSYIGLRGLWSVELWVLVPKLYFYSASTSIVWTNYFSTILLYHTFWVFTNTTIVLESSFDKKSDIFLNIFKKIRLAWERDEKRIMR